MLVFVCIPLDFPDLEAFFPFLPHPAPLDILLSVNFSQWLELCPHIEEKKQSD